MPNIKKVDIASKTIYGLSVRTSNVKEMEIESQKIGGLWESFMQEIAPKMQPEDMPYGVYYHYASDMHGTYAVLAGIERPMGESVDTVMIEAGRYLCFPVKGEFPQAIIEGWQKVWAYFEDPSIDERRQYGTDFERYLSRDEAEIYIGVHYF